MKPAVRDLLPEYVLGVLEPAQMELIARELSSSPELQAEVEQLTLSLAQVAETVETVNPVEPSPGARARLMAAVDTSDRFSPFVATLSRLFDMTADAVRQLLARIDDATTWEPGLPGMLYQHFTPGPRLQGVDAGLVRLEAGASFPRHQHVAGNEINFVLEGSMRDGDTVHGPGSVVIHDQDTIHDYAATADRPLIIIVVNHGIQPVFG